MWNKKKSCNNKKMKFSKILKIYPFSLKQLSWIFWIFPDVSKLIKIFFFSGKLIFFKIWKSSALWGKFWEISILILNSTTNSINKNLISILFSENSRKKNKIPVSKFFQKLFIINIFAVTVRRTEKIINFFLKI